MKSILDSFDKLSIVLNTELQETDDLILDVHSEIRETVYLAIADPENFSIDVFNQYLITQGKDI